MGFYFSLQIKLCNPKPFFGTRVSELVHLIHQTKSLSAAAREMEMSHTESWRILRATERNLGYSLTEKIGGGPEGGGSFLTEDGLNFMQRYDVFYPELKKMVNSLFNNYFSEAIK